MLAVLPLLAMLLLAKPSPPPVETGEGSVVVYLADGTTVPLQQWSLSYEWVAWPKKASPAFASPGRRQMARLWAGKAVVPVSGAVVELTYAGGPPKMVEPGTDTPGAPPPKPATGLVVASGGRRSELRLDVPPREFLAPHADKDVILMARSLELRGQSLTGSERVFCLLSYSTTVQCAGTPGDQVVRLEFSAPSQ